MTENQLSAKELYEQRKAEKGSGQSGRSKPSNQEGGRSWWPWVVVFLVLVGTVFGLYKLAAVTPPGGGVAGGTLYTPVNESDWTDGNRSAKAQLVEYSDPQCPACAFYASWVERLRHEFKADLGVTYRHFPLTAIHPNAQIAAQVAEAAGLQGKFWLAADTILGNQKNWADHIAPRESLYQLVGAIGVDLAKLKRDVDSKKVKDGVAADLDSGEKSGVNGTPTFFLNGQRIANPQSYEEFRQLIIDAGK